MMRQAIAGLLGLMLTTHGLPAGNNRETLVPGVQIEHQEYWTEPIRVPGDLPWNPLAISDSTAAIKSLRDRMNKEVLAFKKAKTVEIRTFTSVPDIRYVWPRSTLYRPTLTKYVGYDNRGARVLSTKWIPSGNTFMSRNLITLAENRCIFRPFYFLDGSTWNVAQFHIKSPRPKKPLNSALQELLARGPEDAMFEAEYENSKLRYILEHKLTYTIRHNELVCRELSRSGRFGEDISVKLRRTHPLWRYTITVNSSNGSAVVAFHKPRPKTIARNVTLDLQGYLASDLY